MSGRPAYQRGRRGGKRAGQWVAVADLGWHAGQRDRREFTAATKAEAERRRDAFLFKRHGGFTLPKGRPLMAGEWLEHWLYHVAQPNVAPTTWYRSYRGAIEDYAMPFFARTPLAELTEEDIEAWHAWLRRRPSARGGHLAASTVANMHRTLSSALLEAVRRGKLPRNPAANVRPPRRDSAEIVPPSLEEVRALLAACKAWPNGARWVLAVTSGLRQGEALALRWRDLKLDGPVPSVTVARSRSRVKGEWVVKAPKTAKSRRTVHLTGAAVTALRAHRAAASVRSLDGLVFTTARGNPVHSGRDHADFQALLRKAGLPPWRVHDLRHACATLLRAEGADARVVQEILGHSSAAFTDRAYVHVPGELQARAVQALDEALGE